MKGGCFSSFPVLPASCLPQFPNGGTSLADGIFHLGQSFKGSRVIWAGGTALVGGDVLWEVLGITCVFGNILESHQNSRTAFLYRRNLVFFGPKESSETSVNLRRGVLVAGNHTDHHLLVLSFFPSGWIIENRGKWCGAVKRGNSTWLCLWGSQAAQDLPQGLELGSAQAGFRTPYTMYGPQPLSFSRREDILKGWRNLSWNSREGGTIEP